ncbi:MAG: tetratricopeptide repeat protein [Candidatus Margulisiibacteriota bacterium]
MITTNLISIASTARARVRPAPKRPALGRGMRYLFPLLTLVAACGPLPDAKAPGQGSKDNVTATREAEETQKTLGIQLMEMTAQDLSSILVRMLGKTNDPKKAWEIYLQKYDELPQITEALKAKGFVNPLLDLDGEINAWTSEVTMKSSNDHDKMIAIQAAIKERITYVDYLKNSEKKPGNTQTAMDVFNSKFGDSLEIGYLFYVMARQAGLKTGMTIKWQKIKNYVDGFHLWPVARAYNWVKIGDREYSIDPAKTILSPGKSKATKASAQDIFESYHAHNADPLKMIKSAVQLGKALEIKPDTPLQQLRLAILYLYSRNETSFLKEIQKLPEDPDAHYLLGLYYLKKKEIGNAKKAFEKVVELDPENMMAYRGILDCCMLDKDVQGAMTALLNMRRIYPADSNVNLVLGAIFSNHNQLEEAMKVLNDVLKVKENPTARLLFAAIYSKTKEYQRSKKAISMAIDYEISQLIIAYILLSQIESSGFNNFKDAEAAIKKAISLDPESALGYLALAVLYDRFDKREEEKKSLERAVELAPTFCEALEKLEQIYKREGEDKKAEEMRNRLKRLKEMKECEDLGMGQKPPMAP